MIQQAIQIHGTITLSEATLDKALAVTLFGENAIHFAPHLTAPQFRAALLHELLHLVRGPVPHAWAEREEQAVLDETARLLVPAGAALALIDHNWTRAEVTAVARHYGVPDDVVWTAVNPPLLPATTTTA